jgi:hypothetical protein
MHNEVALIFNFECGFRILTVPMSTDDISSTIARIIKLRLNARKNLLLTSFLP